MKWLLWREYRLSLLILGVAAFLLLVPYVVILISFCVLKSNLPSHTTPWAAAVGGAACYSVILNQLTFALLGGHAFAGERGDGSAEFMAYQPVSRAQRIISKLLLVLLTGIVVWGLNYVVGVLVGPQLVWRLTQEMVLICSFVFLTGLAFFCIGWLVSAVQSSTTFAVAAALIAPFLLMATLQFIAWWLQWGPLDQRRVSIAYAVGCALMALVCFPLGTWYFLRRVEP